VSRHRIRFLAAKGQYVCSKRYCPFTTNNLTEAMVHCVEENKAVASTPENPHAEAA
jgi:hypothetical protein